MPTYLYYCEIHGEFEQEHSIKEIREFCPICQQDNKSQKIKRLITPNAGFILIGSGWAKEGYSK